MDVGGEAALPESHAALSVTIIVPRTIFRQSAFVLAAMPKGRAKLSLTVLQVLNTLTIIGGFGAVGR
jgi:hypothetical protein